MFSKNFNNRWSQVLKIPALQVPALQAASRLFPLTPLGLLFTLFSVLILSQYAYDKLDLILLVMGYCGIGLVLFSSTFVITAACIAKIKWRTIRQPNERVQTETQSPTVTKFEIPHFRFLPFVRFQLDWDTAFDENGQQVLPHRIAKVSIQKSQGKSIEQITPIKRGTISSVKRRLTISDVLGLSSISITHKNEIHLEVLPHLGKLSAQSPLWSSIGGDGFSNPKGTPQGDRIDLRQYSPGDPARFIHWKAFGRSQKLMTRIPESAIEPLHKTAAFLLTGNHDEPSAATARVALVSHSLGRDWAFSMEGTKSTVSTVPEALALLIRNPHPHRQETKDEETKTSKTDQLHSELEDFAKKIQQQGPSSLIVFSQPVFGPWVQCLKKIKKSTNLIIQVIITIDKTDVVSKTEKWKRVFIKKNDDEASSQTHLEKIARDLRSAAIETIVVSRVTGKVLLSRDEKIRTETSLRGAA